MAGTPCEILDPHVVHTEPATRVRQVPLAPTLDCAPSSIQLTWAGRWGNGLKKSLKRIDMDFSEFSGFKAQVLAQDEPPFDASETCIVRSLAGLATPINQLSFPDKAHLCEVAERWLDYFQLGRSLKPRTLISTGVRHSLSLLFKIWASEGKVVLIPDNVYPVYAQLAQAEGLAFKGYSPWPDAWSLSSAKADIILVTNPAKPRGSALSAAEGAALENWLRQAPHRRVVVDAAYNFCTPFDPGTLRLMASDQTIVLHSLSKSWVRPLVMGVALVPEQDIERFSHSFRAASHFQPELRLAHALLAHDTAFPSALVVELRRLREKLQEVIFAQGCSRNLEATVPTYLFVVEIPFEKMLVQHGVLGIPLSVFGRDSNRHCVLSSLGLAG